jgi:F-type H+-transporting ATPase subunit delta
MISTLIAKRYAQVFMEFAEKSIGIPKAIEELRNLKDVVMAENPEFLPFLQRVDITFSEKVAFIDAVLGAEFSGELKEFLRLLLKKKHIGALSDIISCAWSAYAHPNQTAAVLKTSFPLDLDVIAAIEEKLEARFQKKFKFYIDWDANLLGGVQVVIGNKIIDGSVRGRLDELKSQLMTVRV